MPLNINGVMVYQKVLASSQPGASLTTLYAGIGRGAFDLTLYAANIVGAGGAAKTFRVQLTGASVTARDIAYDVSLPAGSGPLEFDIPYLGLSDIIKVYGSDANVDFVLIGCEAP